MEYQLNRTDADTMIVVWMDADRWNSDANLWRTIA